MKEFEFYFQKYKCTEWEFCLLFYVSVKLYLSHRGNNIG
jgi:hypothetical protein